MKINQIFSKKYVKLKGNLWMKWYDFNEEVKEDVVKENEHESGDKGESEGVTRRGGGNKEDN